MSSLLDEVLERVAAERAAGSMRRRFAAEPGAVAAGVVGDGVVQFRGQLYNALGGLGEEGDVVAVANVGRPGAAVYGPVSGGGARAVATASSAPSAAPAGSISAHALSGTYHTGLLADSQAPQFLKMDGTRPLTGNLAVDSGATVDGVDISAHAADVNAHHDKLHGITDAGHHSVAGSAWQVVGLSATNTLGLLASSDAPGADVRLLRSTSAGGLTLVTLAATGKLTAPRVETASGALALAPASGVVTLPAGGTVNTATGNTDHAPAGNLRLAPGGFVELADGKALRTASFASGFAGHGLQLDQGVSEAGKTSFSVDNLWVRGTMHVYELLMHQIRATNGSVFVSNVGKAVNVTLHAGTFGVVGSDYKVYWDTAVGNQFVNNDILRAQRWDAASSTIWRSDLQVIGTTAEYSVCRQVAGGWPVAGMEFVRLGNTSDTNRQGGVYMTADDDGAPFIDVFDGVANHAGFGSAGVIKGRFGKLSGLSVGVAGEYGLYVQGKNVGDYFLVSPLQGVNLVTAGGGVKITETAGIEIAAPTTQTGSRTISFTSGGATYGELYTVRSSFGSNVYLNSRETDGARDARVQVNAYHTGSGGDALVAFNADPGPGASGQPLLFSLDARADMDGFATLLAPHFDVLSHVTIKKVNPVLRLSSTDTGQTVVQEFVEQDYMSQPSEVVKGRVIYAGANSAGGRFFGLVNDGADWMGFLSDLQLWSSKAGAERMRLTSSDLQIGLNGAALSLRGTDHVYAAWWPRGTAAGRKAYAGFGAAGSTQFNLINEDTGGMLIQTNGNSAQLFLASGGNVAVGNSSASEKLHVSGKVLSTAVDVTADPGSGVAGRVTLANASNWTIGSGVGSIKMTGTTARTNAAWLKIYIGASAAWIPVWTNIS